MNQSTRQASDKRLPNPSFDNHLIDCAPQIDRTDRHGSPAFSVMNAVRCYVQSRENDNYDNQTNDDTKCVGSGSAFNFFRKKRVQAVNHRQTRLHMIEIN